MTPLETSIAGMAAGLIHVLSGPDHLAAVAPFASRTPERAWTAGFRWGLGHTGGVLVMGVMALFLRGFLPLDTFSTWSERIVGVTLVVIGIWGLRAAFRTRIHGHVHDHGDGERHTHIHVHAGGKAAGHDHAEAHTHSHARTHAPMYVGLLHGVSGGSHLLGILPALALPDTLSASMYLTGFGLASVAGMTAFAWTVGRITRTAGERIAAAGPTLLALCSAGAVVIGGFWIFTSV